MFKKFICDERGVSDEVFKLAMIIIIMAAVLAVLAAIIKPVGESSKTATNAVSKAMECEANKTLCEQQGKNWSSTECKCN